MADDTMPTEYDNEREEIVGSEYSSKSEFSKAILSQSQVMRCLELRSKDMRPGYTTWIVDKTGSSKPVVVMDSRKEFISAIEALKNLLAPEMLLEHKELGPAWAKGKEELFDEFCYNERKNKEINGDGVKWTYTGRKYMPHKGQPLPDDDPKKPNSLSTVSNPSLWDSKIDAYWDAMLELADEMFGELNMLVHKLDYFKTQTGY